MVVGARVGAIDGEGLFKLLVEHSNDVVVVTDESGTLRFAGGPTQAILGAEPHELVGTPGFDAIHPDDAPAVRAAFRDGIATPGASRRVEYRYCRRDGRIVRLEAVGTNRLDDPRIRGIVVNIRDITQIRETQQQLLESDTRYRSIVDSSPMGIHSYTVAEGNRLILVGANPAADRILGIDHHLLLGKAIEEAFPPLAQTEVPARYLEVALTGTPWNTSQIDYEDGRIRGAFEVFAFQTAANSMAAIFLDITTRLRAEHESRRLEAQLAQAQRLESIGRLAGGVAHDFNNLLTAITGSVDLALMDVSPMDPLCQTLVDVRGAAESAAALTKQLLAFSRRQVVERRVLNLSDTVRQSLRMLRRLIGEDVELTFTPEGPQGNALLDPGQVEQVLVNLAVNAADSMPHGGRLTIETGLATLDAEYCARHPGATPGCHVVLRVGDTGSGMTDEVLGHIFEPFFTTKPMGKGTGLGLATVFGIVSQNGGTIDVRTQEGQGTTFEVYLPRVIAAVEPAPPATPAMPRGNETIFLVEDEDVVRGIAEKVLKRQGYQVSAFENGGEALMALQSTAAPVHLLLTDVVLPGINGRVLAENMQALRPGMKVLYCSGYTGNVVEDHGVLEHGVEFIGKPYSPLELAQKVRAVLDGRHR